MENPNLQRAIDESIQAGQQARDSLLQAKDCFSSAAGDWGLLGFLDLVGCRLIATIVRSYRMKDAEQLVQQTCSDLKQFGKELPDVDTTAEFRVETGDFLTFADCFLEDFPMDWLLQTKSRIQDAEMQVDDAIERVEKILRQLGGLCN